MRPAAVDFVVSEQLCGVLTPVTHVSSVHCTHSYSCQRHQAVKHLLTFFLLFLFLLIPFLSSSSLPAPFFLDFASLPLFLFFGHKRSGGQALVACPSQNPCTVHALCSYLTSSASHKQEEGLALWDLSASPDGALYKDSITRFWGPKPHGLPYHTFSHGDIVLISKHAPGIVAILVARHSRHAPATILALMARQQPTRVRCCCCFDV